MFHGYLLAARKDFGEKGIHVPDISFPVTTVQSKPPQTAVGHPNDASRIVNLNVDDLIVIKSSFECKFLIMQ